MPAESWQPILHEVGTIIVGSAAVIAAVSSLKNGRTLKNGTHQTKAGAGKRSSKPAKKKTSNGDENSDWYNPPVL